MMDRHRANVCSNNNCMPLTEEMKDGMQPLSFGEIPSFDFSESLAPLTNDLKWVKILRKLPCIGRTV